MRVVGWTVVALALMGCQEYNLAQEPPAYQGPNPPALGNDEVTDRILQVPIPSADVLWIVDNSGSMADEQAALRENFDAFMNYLFGSGVDYHIGVVTTDMDNPAQTGKLVPAPNGNRYITPEDDDPVGLFNDMADVGTSGSSTESGRDAAYMGLVFEANATNAGFLRDDRESGIHMIVVSDEPDGSRLVSKNEFISWSNSQRPEDDLVTFNSIVAAPLPFGPDWIPDSGDYLDLTDGIGGLKHDIAVEDWDNVLDQLGLQAAGLRREYFLSHRPVVDTIEVTVLTPGGDTIPFESSEWTYSSSRNSVTFETYLPDPLSEIYIDYTVLSSLVEVVDAG